MNYKRIFLTEYRGGVLLNITPSTTLNYIIRIINVVVMNALYFIWGILNRKKIVFKTIVKLKLPLGFDNVYINKFNGTAVFLYKNKVVKYFFKDVERIKSLYNILDVGKLYSRHKFCVVVFKKFSSLNFKPNNNEVFELISNSLSGVNLSHASNFNFFDRLSYAITNNTSMTVDCEIFLNDLYDLISSSELNVEFTPAHGDVWLDNILIDANNSLVLIDYDKLMLSPEYYDYIYYLFMADDEILVHPHSYWIKRTESICDIIYSKMHIDIAFEKVCLSVLFVLLLKCAETNPSPNFSGYEKSIIIKDWKKVLGSKS